MSLQKFRLCSAVLLGILVCASWAVESLMVQGRVDRLDSGSSVWNPLESGRSLSSHDRVRLLPESRLTLQGDAGGLGLFGPAQAQLFRRPSLEGVGPEWLLQEWSGLLDMKMGDSSRTWLSCGPVTLSRLQGNAMLLCRPDSSDLLVWMQGGQLRLRRGAQESLLAGAEIRHFRYAQDLADTTLDSVQAMHILTDWRWRFPSAQIPSREVGFRWKAPAPIPQNTRWDLNQYLEGKVLAMAGFAPAQDSLLRFLDAKVLRFEVIPQNTIWTVVLRVELSMGNRRFSAQNRTLMYEKVMQVPHSNVNNWKMLRLLPLEAKNIKVENSAMGELAQDFLAFLNREVLDPFRAGAYERIP